MADQKMSNNWDQINDCLKIKLNNKDVFKFKQWLISQKYGIIKNRVCKVAAIVELEFVNKLYQKLIPLSPSKAYVQEKAWYMIQYTDIIILHSEIEQITDKFIKEFIYQLVKNLPVELQTIK